MTSEEIIRDYYQAWIDSDRDRARAFLADDLKFRSPDDEFDTADSFLDKCWVFSEGFDRMDMVHELYGEAGGYIVYSFGEFACGELIKTRDGKIVEIYVTFQPTR